MRYLFMVLLCFCVSEGRCDSVRNYFNQFHLNMRSGLPHNGVCDILRDSRGYTWFATYNGVSIFNGYTLRNVSNGEQGDYLSSNRVRALAEDANGNIWIGTETGLDFYNRKFDSFSELPLPYFESHSNYLITKLLVSGNYIYAVADGYGVLRYDLSGNLIGSVEFTSGTLVNDAVVLADDNLLLATSCGLLQCISMELLKVEQWWGSSISALYNMGSDKLFIAPERGYFECSYILDNNRINITKRSDKKSPKLQVYAICVDSRESLWLGTRFDGVQYISDSKEQKLLNKERISCFCPMANGSVWCASYDSGAFEFYESRGEFVDLSELSSGVDLRFAKYSKWGDDKLLVRTMSQEFYTYNIIDKSLSSISIPFEGREVAPHKTLQSTNDGGVLMVLDNDEFVKLTKNGEVVRISSPLLSSLPDVVPMTSAMGEHGDLWLGYSDALYRVQLNNDKVERVESVSTNAYFNGGRVPKIRAIYPEENSVWVGTTTDGLLRIDYEHSMADSEVFDDYLLPSEFVSSVIRAKDGALYVGTEGGGLVKMGDDATFEVVGGLSNNIIKSIVEDNDGNLWVATNYGLNRIDSTTEKFYISDGLSFDEFWYEGESFESGELVFSSSNSVMVFNSSDFSTECIAPNLEFSGLKIANDIVGVRDEIDGRVILSHVLSHNDKIQLNYDENIFSFYVDVLGDRPSDKYTVSYKLSPLNDQWIDISVGEIALSGLEAGDYTLSVRASNAMGQQSDIKVLHIDILPPYWATTTAMVIYILLLLLVLLVVFVTILRFVRLRDAKNNLEEMNREKQQYFSNIAHELKTPLSLIIAPIDSLAERFRFDVDITSKVDIIRRQSRRMLRLIESTHRLHLDEINMLKINSASFDFGLFLTEVVDDFRFSVQYDSKEFICENTEGLYVEADRVLIEMALNNILLNACKYTDKGDTIAIECSLCDGDLKIIIKDSGAGISQEDLPYIFDRYFTRGSSLRQFGSGLGLSFTRRIIELHGGSISVSSTLGVGSQFTVVLPIITNGKSIVNADKSSDSVVLDDLSPATEVDSPWRDSLVFVVEDDAEMRSMICEVLSSYFRVRSFGSGDECFAQMASLWPHIVVSDVMMAGGDGYSLCRRIKSELPTSHIPVILLTGCGSLDDKMAGFDSGADDYIAKPFHTAHLVGRIAQLLRLRLDLRKRYEVGIPLEMGENLEVVKIDNEFLELLYSLFEKNLDNELLDMDYVASEFGLSRSTLYQKVRSLTDSTPFELLKIYRLKRAASFLESGTMNVNEVFLSVGFKNRSHFVKVFKERYGVSPSAYSKGIRD